MGSAVLFTVVNLLTQSRILFIDSRNQTLGHCYLCTADVTCNGAVCDVQSFILCMKYMYVKTANTNVHITAYHKQLM